MSNLNQLLGSIYIDDEIIDLFWNNTNGKTVSMSIKMDMRYFEDILLGVVNGKTYKLEFSEKIYNPIRAFLDSHLDEIESILLYHIHKKQALTPINGLATLPYSKDLFFKIDFLKKIKMTKMESYTADRNLLRLFNFLMIKK